MDELKLLLDLVSKLPQMALWVVGMYFVYKLSILGSIYATIRFVTERAYNWAMEKKTNPQERIRHSNGIYNVTLQSDGANDTVLRVLESISGAGRGYIGYVSSYVSNEDALWLKKAVEEKRERDATKTVTPS